MNSNGLLLLSKYTEHSLAIPNTMFRQADKYKTRWMHLIDHVIPIERDIRDVFITRAMRGAGCWTDYRLVRTKLNLHITAQYRKRSKKARPVFNTNNLLSLEIK